MGSGVARTRPPARLLAALSVEGSSRGVPEYDADYDSDADYSEATSCRPAPVAMSGVFELSGVEGAEDSATKHWPPIHTLRRSAAAGHP